MQVESLVSISFTGEELKNSLLCTLECEMNDCVPGTREYERKRVLIDHIRNETCSMEWVNGKFCLSADGIATVEPF